MTPGLVIAAPRSGAGKTTITLGLMRALVRRGLSVQAFKCGPDYIDPAFHSVATGRPSFNLDGWAMTADAIAGLVLDHAADIAIVEGVMGLFDGAGGTGSTADLAALLGWPVVLVLDAKGQTETAAAVAQGCARYRDDVTVAGVILNRIASPRHLALIQPGFERIGLPILGAVANDERLELPERHLGLVQAAETANLESRLATFADVIEASVSLDTLRRSAKALANNPAAAAVGFDPPGQRIALAQDRAFSFIYPHLVERWRAAGAEILPFSPLADEAPARDADAVWLPGGYPELHGATLAVAQRFRAGLHGLAVRSVPIHGECGGYMVLGQGIEDGEGRRHAMVGLLRLETSFATRALHLGYRRARLRSGCALGPQGTEVLGHEFHYARRVTGGDDPLVDCLDATGAPVAEIGARRGSVSGTFFHAISATP